MALSPNVAVRRFARFTTLSFAWKVAAVAAALYLFVQYGGGH